jgi:ABC-type lipoprotein export system ATPase subunit
MTAALIRQREAIYGASDVVRARLGLGRDHEQQGPDSLDWLGVPLTSGDEVRGAIVVQAYHRPDMYGPEQAALLAFVARHILTALERKQHLSTLEHRVKERTLELLLANEELTTEVAERKRAQDLLARVGLAERAAHLPMQLSGGERNRVHLAKMLKEGANVLLLDEPTNDLDVNTLRALEEALQSFAGCAVVISHDRWFLDRVATHILAFEGDSQVVWFDGNYSQYEADRRERLGIEAERPHRITYRKLMRD